MEKEKGIAKEKRRLSVKKLFWLIFLVGFGAKILWY